MVCTLSSMLIAYSPLCVTYCCIVEMPLVPFKAVKIVELVSEHVYMHIRTSANELVWVIL